MNTEVRAALLTVLARLAAVDPAQLAADPEQALCQLALDSLALLELRFELEDQLGLSLENEELDGATTVAQLLACAEAASERSGCL